jgi:hypothetical protein
MTRGRRKRGAFRNKFREEQGVFFVLFIIVLLVLFAFAALALGVGNFMVVRNELQNIADSAVGCAPHGMVTIVSFSTIVITKVVGPPEKSIYGAVECHNVVSGRGSGNYYGTKESIPGLLQ